MAMLLDSADLKEARAARAWPWVEGVTTNPSLLASAGGAVDERLRQLASLDFQHVYYQVRSATLDAARDEAHAARELLGTSLVLKLPPTSVGWQLCAEFSQTASSRVPCCVTAVFSVAQAVLARSCGASQVAVYVSRVDRLLADSMTFGTGVANGNDLVQRIAHALEGSQTHVLAASLKSVDAVEDALQAGAMSATVGFSVLEQLTHHAATEAALGAFDAKGAGLV